MMMAHTQPLSAPLFRIFVLRLLEMPDPYVLRSDRARGTVEKCVSQMCAFTDQLPSQRMD